MFQLSLILCLVFSAVATQAQAAEEVVATGTHFFVQTRGGQPAVCGLEYQIAFRDRTNRQGALTAAHGSLSWLSAPDKKVALMLKIGGLDFDQRTQKPVAKFPVLRGFVALNGKPLTPLMTSRCEDPQEFCAVYSTNAAVLVLSAVLPPQARTLPTADLNIGQLRQSGGLDVVVPLEVDRENFASNEYRSFLMCMDVLDRQASAK
jgi:hypothetical protein